MSRTVFFGLVAGTVTAAVIVVACGTPDRAGFDPLASPEAGPDVIGSAEARLDLGDGGREAAAPACPSNDCLPFRRDCNADASDGCEVNIRSDVANCGACGNDCRAEAGTPPMFSQIACIDGHCTLICQDTLMTGPMRNCAGSDPMIADPVNGCPNQLLCDPQNCGACGVVVPPDPTGDRICAAGTPWPACPKGLTNCGGSCGRQCRDLDHDPMNCGTCGHSCPDTALPAATAAALDAKHIRFGCGPVDGGTAKCQAMCGPGWDDCNGDLIATIGDPTNSAYDGCETPIEGNIDNCGACGNKCQSVCHQKKGSRTDWVCDCPAGLTWCGDPPPGECASLNDDPHHCGSCPNSCPGPTDQGHGAPTCLAGQCGYDCKAGYGNCNGVIEDGCEVDLMNAHDHCGACGHACAKDQRCGNGVCLTRDCPPEATK